MLAIVSKAILTVFVLFLVCEPRDSAFENRLFNVRIAIFPLFVFMVGWWR